MGAYALAVIVIVAGIWAVYNYAPTSPLALPHPVRRPAAPLNMHLKRRLVTRASTTII